MFSRYASNFDDAFLFFTVNLTGVGRVDMSNFELLKVLGTGGEYIFH
jgi:hypothetical protein